MPAQSCSERFEQDAMPHRNSAYNLARWLTRSHQDAEDIVQEAYLRAFKSYHRFRGGDARPWLLKIVRNVTYTSLQKRGTREFIEFDEAEIATDPGLRSARSANPEEVLIKESSGVIIHRALERLPSRFREMVILRELEGMSYREISTVLEIPAGTVMSTLSRARARLRQSVEVAKSRPEAER